MFWLAGGGADIGIVELVGGGDADILATRYCRDEYRRGKESLSITWGQSLRDSPWLWTVGTVRLDCPETSRRIGFHFQPPRYYTITSTPW